MSTDALAPIRSPVDTYTRGPHASDGPDTATVAIVGGVSLLVILGTVTAFRDAWTEAMGGVPSRFNAMAVQNRFAVDMARAGTCGGPAKDRRRAARTAQELGEWREERAVSEPYGDLSRVLAMATDDPESHELCARGLAEVWRAEHPFRKGRPGDPLDVLLPHLTDETAVLALDRARALPRLPPLELLQLARDVDLYLKVDIENRLFDRTFALALLGTVQQEVNDLRQVLRGAAQQRQLDELQDALRVAANWNYEVDEDTLHALAVAERTAHDLRFKGRASSLRFKAPQVVLNALNAIKYVLDHADYYRDLKRLEPLAASGRANRGQLIALQQRRRVFPES